MSSKHVQSESEEESSTVYRRSKKKRKHVHVEEEEQPSTDDKKGLNSQHFKDFAKEQLKVLTLRQCSPLGMNQMLKSFHALLDKTGYGDEFPRSIHMLQQLVSGDDEESSNLLLTEYDEASSNLICAKTMKSHKESLL